MKFLSSRKTNLPSLFFSNLRSLVPKFDEICTIASTIKPDIFSFCETWLSDKIDDQNISIPGYSTLLRHDRATRRGGGVCVYCRDEVLCSEVQGINTPPSCIEGVWMALPESKLVVLTAYVPPNLTSSQHKCILEYIISQTDTALEMFPEPNFMIIGDLNNLPTEALEMTLGLRQIIEEPTRRESILDKVLMENNLCEKYLPPAIGPCIGNADHQVIFLKPRVENLRSIQLKKVYDYRHSNLSAFVNNLKQKQWQNFYKCEETLEVKCDLFYDFIREAYKTIPCNYVEMSSKDKPWITPLLKHLINCRFEAYRLGQFDKYRHYKSKVKTEIAKAKASWMESLKKRPSGIWGAMTTSKQANASVSSIRALGPTLELIADQLNHVFSSVFNPRTITEEARQALPDVIGPTTNWNVEISCELTSKLLANLKPRKSAGSDGLSSRLLRMSHGVLSGPLTHLFALSISNRKIPTKWKMAYITPIPKTQKPTLNDFRPISLLPIPSKILELLVLKSVKQQLINLYGKEQFGFRPGSSTLNAHLEIHDFVTCHIDSVTSAGVLMITLDLSKAFDRLSHISLLHTLMEGDLPKDFVVWVMDFLSNRKQKVIFNGTLSTKETCVTSGVPQGSILAPYLFAAHIGSLKAVDAQTKLIKYADDITLLIPFDCTAEHRLATLIEDEIENVRRWCGSHGLTINDSKTKAITFGKTIMSFESVSSKLPTIVNKLRVLGITFQSSLKWDAHVDHITKVAARRVFVLRYLKRFPTVNKKDLLSVYNGYILSVLEFNAPLLIGLNSKNNEKMERIRKRCHKIVCGPSCKCDAFTPLRDRRQLLADKAFKRILSAENISNGLLPHRLPRTGHFFQEYLRTDRRARSFIPYCIARWNHLRLSSDP